MPDISNCVSIVTGGASGIGRSLALALARIGGTGIVIADMRLGPAEQVAQEVRQAGVCAEAIECDVTSEAQVEDLARRALGRFGDVNLLFNVAGVSLMRKLHETSAKDVEWLFSVNVFGLCHMIRHFVPSLKAAAGRGECAHIVNFSSGFGLAVPAMGPLLPTAYAGTKHAVVGLSDALRKELESDGIGVSVVCPGLVNTEAWNSTSFRQARFGGPIQGTEESRKRVEAWGQNPAETASLVLAALARGEFYILPLSDTGRSRMRSELNERFEALGKAIDPEV